MEQSMSSWDEGDDSHDTVDYFIDHKVGCCGLKPASSSMASCRGDSPLHTARLFVRSVPVYPCTLAKASSLGFLDWNPCR